MSNLRTLMSILTTTAVAPDGSGVPTSSGKLALYASVGNTLTHYEVDVQGATLSRRNTVSTAAPFTSTRVGAYWWRRP